MSTYHKEKSVKKTTVLTILLDFKVDSSNSSALCPCTLPSAVQAGAADGLYTLDRSPSTSTGYHMVLGRGPVRLNSLSPVQYSRNSQLLVSPRRVYVGQRYTGDINGYRVIASAATTPFLRGQL
jgi:hypothetical protein